MDRRGGGGFNYRETVEEKFLNCLSFIFNRNDWIDYESLRTHRIQCQPDIAHKLSMPNQ